MCWLRLIDANEVPFTSRMSHASGVVAGSYRGTGDTTWVDTAPAAARRRPGLARSWKRGRPAGAAAAAPGPRIARIARIDRAEVECLDVGPVFIERSHWEGRLPSVPEVHS